MRFKVDGEDFHITFRQDHPEVTFFDPNALILDEYGTVLGRGKIITGPSKFPSTTVIVFKGKDQVFRTDTVKHHHTDKFSPEKGRVLALRKISETLDKPFKRAMWEAYTNRPRASKVARLEASLKAIKKD